MFCIISLFANSQTMQIYDGPFKLGQVEGNARYSYYENENFERVYNGNFIYTYKIESATIDIKGKFIKDKRDGNWTITFRAGSGFMQNETNLNNVICILNVNYKDGIPDGIWTSTLKQGEKLKMTDKRVFSQGRLIDKWYFEDFEKRDKLNVKLDNESVIVESDYVMNGETQEIKKYQLGYCILEISRNVQSGESSVKRVDDAETLAKLVKIEKYLKLYPDSLQDLPVKLVKKNLLNSWDNFLNKPYELTFDTEIRGVVKDEKQLYGIFSTDLVDQETREQIRQKEEKIRSEKLRIEQEMKIRLEQIRLKQEEENRAKEKRLRLEQEVAKTNDLKSFDLALYQKIFDNIKTNCIVFLKNCIQSNYSSSFNYKFSAEFLWSPKEIVNKTTNVNTLYHLAPNVTPYLYYNPIYSVDKASIPESFNKVFEIDQLANLEKDFEGEKYKMLVSARYDEIKIEYVNSSVKIKLNKDKEIVYETAIPENQKNDLEGKIKQLEKGKYSLNYKIAYLNGEVINLDIQQLK